MTFMEIKEERSREKHDPQDRDRNIDRCSNCCICIQDR